MNTCCAVRSSRPAGLFSFGLLDGPQVRLRRPYLREAPAGFGLERLATAFINNPGFHRTSVSLTGLGVHVSMNSFEFSILRRGHL
jgi:hypothetical protein